MMNRIINWYVSNLNKFRKNLASPGKQLLRCSTTYVRVDDLDRSPLMRGFSYASADDRPILFAIFSLIFVPSMQHAG